MEGNDIFCCGQGRDVAGLFCREMIFLGGDAPVGFHEGRFDVELIGPLGQGYDFVDICGTIENIRDISDFLSRRDESYFVTQGAKRDAVDGVYGRNVEDGFRGSLFKKGLLEGLNPGPGFQVQGLQCVFVYVDVKGFLDAQTETGYAMVQNFGGNGESGLLEQA